MNDTAHTVNRAARLKLRSRLDLSRHASELLRNKEEALRRERARLEGHANHTRQQWRDRCTDAAALLLRARALGASAEVAAMLERPAHPAGVTIDSQTSMGVTYPGTVHCTPGSTPVLTTTAVLIIATEGYRIALTSGAQAAAAAAALDRVQTELAHTRRRRRAIEQRLQPHLETQLHRLDLDLDERDRDAAVRTQLATRQDT